MMARRKQEPKKQYNIILVELTNGRVSQELTVDVFEGTLEGVNEYVSTLNNQITPQARSTLRYTFNENEDGTT